MLEAYEYSQIDEGDSSDPRQANNYCRANFERSGSSGVLSCEKPDCPVPSVLKARRISEDSARTQMGECEVWGADPSNFGQRDIPERLLPIELSKSE